MNWKFKNFYERHSRWVCAAAVFLPSFVLYAATAPHTIFTNDNPEFVTAAATAGIPHPSGYPLYVILAWLAAKLPLGTLAYRVNLFSALCAAASLVMGYLILDKIIRELKPERQAPSWIAAAMILPFAATGIFWFQAIVAKTYSLNLLLTLIAVWLAVKCREERRPRHLFWFALVAGLGLSDHLMFALVLPFLAVLLIRRRLWTKRIFLICGALFLLGLAPYAYIPIRSAMHPLLNRGQVGDWRSFWLFVTRAQYGDLGGGNLADKIKYLEFFTLGVWDQFRWFLLLMPIGLIRIFKLRKQWCYVLSAVLVSNVVGIIVLRNSEFSYPNAAFNAPYYLPAYSVIFILSAIGLQFCLRSFKKYAMPAILAVCLGSAIFYLQINFRGNDLHAFKFIDDLSRRTLLSLPKDSVFIISVGNAAGDTTSFMIMYQQYADDLRPDVAIICLPEVFPQADGQAVTQAFSMTKMADRRAALYEYALKTYPGRPIYATFPYSVNGAAPQATPYAYGLLETPSTVLPPLTISKRDRYVLERDIFGEQVLADYYYQQAGYYLQNNDNEGAAAALDAAIRDDPMPGSRQFADYVLLRTLLRQK